MRKKNLLQLAIALLLAIFIFSCEEEVDPPEPDFSATVSGSNTEIIVSFKDLSSNSPKAWHWTFEGGNPSTSNEKNPTVTYSSHGTFNVTLEVVNDGGTNETTKYDYVNIIRFNNPLFTDIDVTVGGLKKTMSPDAYLMFGQIDNQSVSYYAQTCGKTTSGTQVGKLISWEYNVDLYTYSSYNLILTSSNVFFYITNNSTYTLTPFYVNYNNSAEQTMDNIEIPNNGVTYRIGYYKAFSVMQVRAYYKYYPSEYAYWINPTNLTIPWTNNQYVELTYSKSIKENDDKAISVDFDNSEAIYPEILDLRTKSVLDKNARNMSQSNK